MNSIGKIGAVLVLALAGPAVAQDSCQADDLNLQIEQCSAVLSRSSDETERGLAYLYRCQAHDMLGRHDTALSDCNEAKALIAEDGAVYNSLSIVYQNLQNNEAAIAASSIAVTLEPSRAGFYNVRANARCAAGQIDNSVKDRLKAMDLGLYSADALQGFLAEEGAYSGAIDGNFGSGSRAALRDWTRAGC